MHAHLLHHPIDVACECCGITTRFEFSSRSDHVVCRGCRRHQGENSSALRQRDTDHLGLWQSENAVLREDHADAIAELNNTIAAQGAEIAEQRELLKSELRRAPEAAVRAWFDSEAIQAANAEVAKSYRSRAHVMRALWEVDRQHHTDDKRTGFCSCGRSTTACGEWQAVDLARDSLYRWEEKQISRARADLDSELPRHHPTMIEMHGEPARRSS